MDVHVTLKGRGDFTTRIYRQLFDAVLDGRLRQGQRLPPTRELACHLAVSRNTVALAYERLVAEGVLLSRVGSGTFVRTRAGRPPSGAARACGSRRAPPIVVEGHSRTGVSSLYQAAVRLSSRGAR